MKITTFLSQIFVKISNFNKFSNKNCQYTANVYSSITDKLMHLFVASTLKCLFWDFLELCDNYRQISVELPNNKNTQRKNWENFEIMKKNSQNYRQISVISAKSDYFQLDSAVVKI